jgi:hypothetical protein
MAKFCRKCGAQLADNAQFCLKCGTPQAEDLNQAPAAPAPQPNNVYAAAPARPRRKSGPISEFFAGDYSRYAPIVLFLIIGAFFFGMLNVVSGTGYNAMTAFNSAGDLKFGLTSFSFFSIAGAAKKAVNAAMGMSGLGGLGGLGGMGGFDDFDGFSSLDRGTSSPNYLLNETKNMLNGYSVLQVFYTIFMVVMILAIVWLLVKMVMKKVNRLDFIILGGASLCWFIISLVSLISISNIDSKLERIFRITLSSNFAVKPTFAGVFSIILIFIAAGACVLPIFTKPAGKNVSQQ